MVISDAINSKINAFPFYFPISIPSRLWALWLEAKLWFHNFLWGWVFSKIALSLIGRWFVGLLS